MNPLCDAYLAGHPEVCARFSSSPESLLERGVRENAWAPGAVESVNGLQHELGLSGKLVSGNEPVIITGQQPGLFTGPLYTILKAISAVQLADRLSDQGVKAVPVFWVASDDDDLVEVQTAHFLKRGEDILSLTYTPDPELVPHADIPLFRVPLSPLLHQFIDSACDACRTSEYADEVRGFLYRSFEGAPSLSGWFSRIMGGLFEETPLRLFEPHRDRARLAAVPVLRKEIEFPLESTRLLAESGRQLRSLGFDVPIKRDEYACNFFVEDHGRRCRVHFRDNRYLLYGTGRMLSVEEMLALLESEPGRFSANVALRPLVQQLLFNPAAYVAGPGEIAYWAQLKTLFSFFELPMPVVFPRISAVFTTAKLTGLLTSYRLNTRDLAGDTKVLAHALRESGDTPLAETFYRERRTVEDALTKMASSLLDVSGAEGVEKAAAAFLARSGFSLDKLERALLYADKEKRARVEGHLTRLRNAFYPLGGPQERVINIFSFLFREGLPLIGRMVRELDCTKTDVQEMNL